MRLAPFQLEAQYPSNSSWELGGKDRTTQGVCSAEEETCRTLSVVCVRRAGKVTASRDETRRDEAGRRFIPQSDFSLSRVRVWLPLLHAYSGTDGPSSTD